MQQKITQCLNKKAGIKPASEITAAGIEISSIE
jgi:hypothetical protein